MDNFNYMFAAYSIIFAAIFLYVMFIWRRQTRIEADVRTLETRLQEVRDTLDARAEATRSASS
ncbi:MAG TPA: CcmD family protein [Candidatus Binataceae bacterium]|nr:CcmD family protein [Candidatus Binataceae bacterium]